MKKYLLPKEGKFYKANLHTHSSFSDGKLSPAELKEVYKELGYSVLAFTDHDIFIPHTELTDENFLALSGFEVEVCPPGYSKRPAVPTCHICFVAGRADMRKQPFWNPKYATPGHAKEHVDEVEYDVTEPFFEREYTPENINEMIRRGREAGFFVTYNHPTWSLEGYETYMQYEGMHAMEIFNTDTYLLGYEAYVPGVYDDMLRGGKKIYAVAADDTHSGLPLSNPKCDIGGGYVMIKSKSLQYEAITDALFKGNFYASRGPKIYDLYIEEGEVHVKTSPAVRITMNTNARSAKSVIAERSSFVEEAVFPLRGDEEYIRISVQDAEGKHADTRAYFMEEL